MFTPVAVVDIKVELVKTTEKSYGLNADKICCQLDPVLINGR